MSDRLDPVKLAPNGKSMATAAIVIALIAVALQLWNAGRPKPNSPVADGVASRWQKIKSTGVLKVGYGGFPPYTVVNANEMDQSRRVTGFSVDLVNEIASRSVPPLKVEWQQFSWDTMKADLASDRFDFIADPVFHTIARAADFSFTEPYSYFGIAVALVRADDSRFKQFQDLNRPDITIALAEGWTSSEYARANLAKPKFKSIPVTGDAVNQLDEVLFGRADVALNDVPTVFQYVKAHKDKVKALWLTAPPSSVAGGFLLRPADAELRQFLDASLRVLRTDGTISRIDQKWKSLGFFPVYALEAGYGLRGTEALPAK
jgi:cystine transport system substrate-binding protein